MDVRLNSLNKEFDGFAALNDISLDIRSGELLGLLGPSGSGKTTLLRLIAGLEFPTSGTVYFGDKDASLHSIRERNVGFVFQHYALFKHLTVFNNIAFGLNVRPSKTRPSKAFIKNKVMELLDLVQLTGLENRYPNQLSGGQRQRVALARAMAIEPQILLLDEPFGALDAQVRRELRHWLREMHDKTGFTTIFVTHDQEEALELSDRVAIMHKGTIEQLGSADDIYDNPKTPFVYDFIGESSNIIIEIKSGKFLYNGNEINIKSDLPDGEAKLFFRPHEIELTNADQQSLNGKLIARRRVGSARRGEVKLDSGDMVEIELPRDYQGQIGDIVHFIPRFYKIFNI
ncbi:sulfate/molybdate ABC transporter ATP-binding protein [Bartonella sp. HY038]|uniref:sulfate/molybdate ABC transporter ATP-binding protein n=1 Tax=Bartonella sp. HY038 TaxID=2759660 RepID=UPI0015FD94BF|nr:sulfate/molybdate ABC transporter ATP-binding protein [Bartonella sp. HY038]